MTQALHILGIRHHGPGSARSVIAALDELKPGCVLVEGPAEATHLIAHMSSSELVPPVAILVYAVDEPKNAAYFPFAEFSPEWQACKWALGHGATVRLIDLPRSQCPVEPGEHPTSDPLLQLAQAAGFDDGERWWEHVVEHRTLAGIDPFKSIEEAMTELRADRGEPGDALERAREAWMRKCIRQAIREGHDSIAVVCGAWHAPALRVERFTAKSDNAVLAELPKVKTAATWIPWTYQRLTLASGYGAGIAAPGWYEHLWHNREMRLERWMARQAVLLRSRDIDCSSAHVIEGVRLAEALAALRHRPLADLSDIADATAAVFCFDSMAPLRLVETQLLVGDRIGHVPPDVPMVPLQQDLTRQQKTLRLKPEAQSRTLDLDLRKENDRLRSQLLHQLRVLEIPWGASSDESMGKGTFHEVWQLDWEPGFWVTLIEASPLGNTVYDAASAALSQRADRSSDLTSLSAILHDAFLAELGSAVNQLVQRIEAVAAVATDIQQLMNALPNLARVLRYGNVRDTDQHLVRRIIDGLLPRITIGLPAAVASLNDQAAVEIEQSLRHAHESIQLIDPTREKAQLNWLNALKQISGQEAVHGLVRGRAARLLFDADALSADQTALLLSQTLSRGADPVQSARWIEGFFSGSGLVLIHDRVLLKVLDTWVKAIPETSFEQVIPLLRRTFSTFPAPERRQLGEVIRELGDTTAVNATTTTLGLDLARARRVLPLLLKILS